MILLPESDLEEGIIAAIEKSAGGQKMNKSKERDRYFTSICPSKRQIAYQQTEYYAFIHFTVNTFTGREWGDGTEPESIFNPVMLDAEQWVKTAKDGQMKGVILTCKHHDGFCLWPSAFTEHSVKNSPYKDGRGDIVKEVSEACRKHGLKFGVYLSPWDRNQKTYGQGEEYNDFFVGQLTELLTNYGDVFAVWFDGACGEGENGLRQTYDWKRYYEVIRTLQPDACICVCGPDIRWCGNEAGDTRPSEWSVVPRRLSWAETVEGKSQKEDNIEFRVKRIQSEDLDLGSRTALEQEEDLIWYPAEVNTSIRPGWFFHAEENDQVKSYEELKKVYLNSVGGNATFLLNLPPDANGLIYSKDVEVIAQLGRFIKKTFELNLAEEAVLSVSEELAGYEIEHVCVPGYEHYFRTPEEKTAEEIVLQWNQEQKIRYIVLQECIEKSQRIEQFEVRYLDKNGEERLAYTGTTVGYKKIIELEDEICTTRLIVAIRDARVYLTVSFIGVYGDCAHIETCMKEFTMI